MNLRVLLIAALLIPAIWVLVHVFIISDNKFRLSPGDGLGIKTPQRYNNAY